MLHGRAPTRSSQLRRLGCKDVRSVSQMNGSGNIPDAVLMLIHWGCVSQDGASRCAMRRCRCYRQGGVNADHMASTEQGCGKGDLMILC